MFVNNSGFRGGSEEWEWKSKSEPVSERGRDEGNAYFSGWPVENIGHTIPVRRDGINVQMLSTKFKFYKHFSRFSRNWKSRELNFN